MIQLPQTPWSTQTCVSLGQRDSIAAFWLAAPDDLLPNFWASPLGEITKALIRQLTPAFQFTADQVSLRNAIGARLRAGLNGPSSMQLLIASWLFSPPGLLTIANPEANLPSWLLPSYLELYGSKQASGVVSSPTASSSLNTPATELPQPDFGAFPDTLQELIGNRVQLNRMLGLANLYYIDPEDREICSELLTLRLHFAQAIERCPEDQFESLWATDLGDRYWAVVRSGIQKEALSDSDNYLKSKVTNALQPANGGGFGFPGALNAFLIAMLYYEPGTMKVNEAEQKLPSWLYSSYQQLFAEALQLNN